MAKKIVFKGTNGEKKQVSLDSASKIEDIKILIKAQESTALDKNDNILYLVAES